MTPIRSPFLVVAATAMLLTACGDAELPADSASEIAGGATAADQTIGDDTLGTDDDQGIATDTAGPQNHDDNPHSDIKMPLLSETIELSNGLSRPVSFVVPEDAVSVTITVDGPRSVSFALGSWIDAEGFSLVNQGWENTDPSLCLSCANRIAPSEGTFAAIAPNGPEAHLVAGAHQVIITGFSQNISGGLFGQVSRTPFTGEVIVSIHVKVLPDLPQSGVLDLNLYFTGAQGLQAANAPTDSNMQRVIEDVADIFSSVGVSIGKLTYNDVPTAFQVIESVTGPDSDLMDLFSQSRGQTNNALNLFLVNELKMPGPMGGFGVILGVSGGVPGPPLSQGTWRSGVAIVIRSVPGAPAAIDTTMAHEMGHFLGLFHTSEQNMGGYIPAIHDPLPDTPENDPRYLMFNTGEGHLLSRWQGRIIRSNPWVRHPRPRN